MYSLCSYQSALLPRNTIHKMNSLAPKRKQAFSLVEVSLSLAIIGIAFTVIIGMLPVGLRQARAATDTTNEARILSGMTAILHATDYEALTTSLTGKLHYFDADGGFLETAPPQSNTSARKLEYEDAHVYQAMFLFSKQPMPGVSGNQYDDVSVSQRAFVIYGRKSKAADSIFKDLTDPSTLAKGSPVKVIPVVVAKMDRISLP